MTKHNQGFTLIEAIVAILILSVTVGSLLQLSAQGFYTVRYLRNQIVANNLLQEGLEYVRNTRDSQTIVMQDSWSNWLGAMKAGGCLIDDIDRNYGCSVDPYITLDLTGIAANIIRCDPGCPHFIYYEGSGFYGYDINKGAYPSYLTSPNADTGNTENIPDTPPYVTDYSRKITIVPGKEVGQVVVTCTVVWKNGDATQSLTQSTVLANWNNS